MATVNAYSICIGSGYTAPKEIAGHIAHESGHYLYHLIAGNDAYMRIYGQMPWDTGSHGTGDLSTRSAMFIEEPAYFADYYQNGTVGTYVDPTEPRSLYTDATKPWKVDAPSIEGFGCWMLASLNRTRSTVADIYSKGQMRTAPVIAAPFSAIIPLLYQAPVPSDNEALANRIAVYLGCIDKGGLFVPLLHSLGWSYTVKGKLLDPEGKPVVGARVKSVADDGTRTWEGMSTVSPSAVDGSFTIPYGVFGLRTALRVYTGSDSQDVDLYIPLATSTNEVFDRGTIALKSEQRHVPLSKSVDIVLTPGIRAQNPLKIQLSGEWQGVKNTLITPQDVSTYIDVQMVSPLHQASQITAQVVFTLGNGQEWTTSLTPGDYGTATRAVTKLSTASLDVREYLGPRDTQTQSTQTPPSLTLSLPAPATSAEYYRADVTLKWDYTQTYFDGSGQQVGSQNGVAAVRVLHVYRDVSSSL